MGSSPQIHQPLMTETYTLSETLTTSHKFHLRSGAQPPRHQYIVIMFNEKSETSVMGYKAEVLKIKQYANVPSTYSTMDTATAS